MPDAGMVAVLDATSWPLSTSSVSVAAVDDGMTGAVDGPPEMGF